MLLRISYLIVLITSLTGCNFFKSKPSQVTQDPLAERYEFWTVELSSTQKHKKCGGKFKGDYKLFFLVSGSLSKTIAKPPTEIPVQLQAQGSYIGNETVVEQTKKKDWQLMPSPIAPTSADVTVSWYKNPIGSKLDLEVASKGPLMNGYCAEKMKIHPNPVRRIQLITTFAEASTMSGTWAASAGEGGGMYLDLQGTFKMTWLAGGPSNKPIPGPPDLRYKIRSDNSVLVEWTAIPRATKYNIYYSKGLQLGNGNKLFRSESTTAFAVINVQNEFPQTVEVSAEIDGVESRGTSQIIIHPAPATN